MEKQGVLTKPPGVSGETREAVSGGVGGGTHGRRRPRAQVTPLLTVPTPPRARADSCGLGRGVITSRKRRQAAALVNGRSCRPGHTTPCSVKPGRTPTPKPSGPGGSTHCVASLSSSYLLVRGCPGRAHCLSRMGSTLLGPTHLGLWVA